MRIFFSIFIYFSLAFVSLFAANSEREKVPKKVETFSVKFLKDLGHPENPQTLRFIRVQTIPAQYIVIGSDFAVLYSPEQNKKWTTVSIEDLEQFASSYSHQMGAKTLEVRDSRMTAEEVEEFRADYTNANINGGTITGVDSTVEKTFNESTNTTRYARTERMTGVQRLLLQFEALAAGTLIAWYVIPRVANAIPQTASVLRPNYQAFNEVLAKIAGHPVDPNQAAANDLLLAIPHSLMQALPLASLVGGSMVVGNFLFSKFVTSDTGQTRLDRVIGRLPPAGKVVSRIAIGTAAFATGGALGLTCGSLILKAAQAAGITY